MATIRERLNDVVQQVTTSLRNGVLPWRVMKDRTETYVVCNPANVVTLNPYQGRNYWLANIACGLNKWDSAWFATYLQWKENGCKVKAGEKSVLLTKKRRFFIKSLLATRSSRNSVKPLFISSNMKNKVIKR